MGTELIDYALAMTLVPLLIGVGELLKKRPIRLHPEAVPFVLMLLGIAISVAYTAATKWPATTGGMWATATVTGLAIGLASGKLYDFGKHPRQPTA